MTGQLQLKSELGWQVGKTGGRAEFTAVFMTYKRNGAVRGLLETLRGIPQLNSVSSHLTK